jgi:hypothetical protein
MKALIGILMAAMAAGGLAGCSQTAGGQPADAAAAGPAIFEVPWTGVAQRGAVARGQGAAGDLLADNVNFGRAERSIEGPQALGTVSAYSDYTFDVERIGPPPGAGWRYRRVVRSGVSVGR